MRTKLSTVLVTALTAVTLAACGDSEEKSSGGGSGDSGSEVSEQARTEYIEGCKASGQPAEACECLVDELEKKGYSSEEDFERLAKEIQEASQKPNPAEALPKEFSEAAQACRDKISPGA